MSEVHAFAARQQFALQCQQGEAGINLAQAAMQISAEDDALVSHSTVALPVRSYLDRIAVMAAELARRLPQGSATSPEEVLQVVEAYLFQERGFRLPSYVRSAVPSGALVDHPGVWEDARHAYLHDALISRTGIAAVLAVLYADIMQRLLAREAVDFAVRMECRDFSRLPQASVLHGLTRDTLLRPDGGLTNTCTSEALVEMLRFLKRAYWPFAWQTHPGDQLFPGIATGGGFAGAAHVALEGEANAQLQAIARTASHRLERGIWTSPGAGDLRRARAACERLAMLCADESPIERRDLGVLLFHCGDLADARAELAAFAASPPAKLVPLAEQRLLQRLLDRLQELGADRSGELVTVDSVLQRPQPQLRSDRKIPLTW